MRIQVNEVDFLVAICCEFDQPLVISTTIIDQITRTISLNSPRK
jgi:hypothetical protein